MKLTNQLKEIRQQAGLTQEQLARQLGVTRQTIIAIEKGVFNPSVKLALKMAKLFGTSVEAIFTLGAND